MRDISPDRAVIVAGLHRRAQRRALRVHPDVGDFLCRQLGGAAALMEACLEIMERHLPYDGVQHILDLACEKPAARAGIIGAVDQFAEGQHLGKDRRGLGQRQRRIRHQISAVGGKTLVNAVAHFVRQRHHIARLAGEIHQNIGVRGWRDRM